MNRIAGSSAVDRLIALASEGERRAAEEAAPQEKRELETIPLLPDPTIQELEQNPVWKTLLQFRMLLPYVSRILGETNGRGEAAAAAAEMQHSLTELQMGHRELRLVSQDQTAQMKRLEEELRRSREAAERHALDSSELVEDVRGMYLMVKVMAGVLGGVGLVMIALMIYLLVHLAR